MNSGLFEYKHCDTADLITRTAAKWLWDRWHTQRGRTGQTDDSHPAQDRAGRSETSDYIMLLRSVGTVKVTTYFWSFPIVFQTIAECR